MLRRHYPVHSKCCLDYNVYVYTVGKKFVPGPCGSDFLEQLLIFTDYGNNRQDQIKKYACNVVGYSLQI